ncbi:hypothetical protein JKF63_02349 [Porcisia hertigi]|uniref:Uncharacterized protein n=1 Tax=Porcisia hertigi TaxID=2761500 RepID=A0A836IIG4_9TRYP|nr:hypothetical protein JKF63_02349 [Porcisia hertigi]
MRLVTHRLTVTLCHVTPLSVVAFFLVWGLSVCCCESAFANSSISTPLSSHALRVTLSEAGPGSNWPKTTDGLGAIRSVVANTVCGALPDGVSNCNAFLIRASDTTLGLQLSTNTLTLAAGHATYSLLSQWVSGKSTSIDKMLNTLRAACEEALSASLSTLIFSTGTYTVPCRGSQTYTYLHACKMTEVPVTTAYILEPSDNVKGYFSAYLCNSTGTSTCTDAIVVAPPSVSSEYTVVTITGLSKGLEAVLAFVAAVRAEFVGAPQAVGPSTGISRSGISAREVQLRYDGMHAVLFSTNENNRVHSNTPTVNIECQASMGYWAFSLIGLLPLCGILFCCAWYRGRRNAKEQERRRVVADEMRIMQGFSNPNDAQAAEKGPPPGFDTSITSMRNTEPRWVTDANGYYYDLNTTTQADAESYETYVDPNTSERYMYIVNNANGTGEATASQELQQHSYTTEKNTMHQTYLHPETGETYQYTTDATEAGQREEQAAEAPAAENTGDAAASGDYQTYVDPNTRETYQYATEEADAAINGYQYVDLATGETYQYVNVPNGEAADQGHDVVTANNVYVDPNTGEMYQYDTLQQ